MSLKTITSIDELGKFRKAWTTILEVNKNTNPFIEFDWVLEWWKHLGKEKNIEIISVLENEEIIAFLPFLYEKKGWIYNYNFIGFGQANYMDFVSYEYSLEYVVEFVMDAIIKKRRNVIFYLHGLLESSFSHSRLEVYLRKKKLSYSTHRVITPYINLEKIQMEEYIKKRQKLHRLDRREKRIRENGEVQALLTGAEHMETIFNIHDKRWKKKHDTSGFTDPDEKQFYRSLALLQDGSFNTEIDGLFLDGKMIAFDYGYRCRGRYISYVLGFDDDFEVFSPGRILEKEKILQCSRRGINIFDLSIGYETYKFEWNTDLDYTRKIIFSSKGLPASMLRFYLSLKESLVARVKVHQRLVLFKRNKIGKLLYVTKNIISKKENKGAREALSTFLRPKLRKLFEWKRYSIYEIASKNVLEDVENNKYTHLTIKDSINNNNQLQEHMRDICTKIYGGYKGYYMAGHLSFKNVFWTNEKVIRIDDISYLINFRKSSVFIENWCIDNVGDISSFVKQQSRANKLFVCVKSSSQKEISELEKLGFTVSQQIFKRTILGFSKTTFTGEKSIV